MTDREPQNAFESDIISIVAHDLKTPISSVKGFIELIQHAGPLNESQQQFAERALGGLQRMERLVVNLLDLSRLESGLTFERVPCDLRAITQEALDLLHSLAAQRGITVQVTGSPPPALGDARLLGQVINNLLSNAIKYNREGGEVAVTFSRRAEPGGDMLLVEVRDTGAGIPEADLPHVFQRFYRANTSGGRVEGSGLGLAIAQMIVAQHGGRIWATSRRGVGSTFAFTLPIAGGGGNAAAAPAGFIDPHTPGELPDGIDDQFQDSPEALDTDSKNDQL